MRVLPSLYFGLAISSLMLNPSEVLSSDWETYTRGGYFTYVTVADGENRFYLRCDYGLTTYAYYTGIEVNIKDERPPPGSEVRLLIDSRQLYLQTDLSGYFRVDTAEDEATFRLTWDALRRGSSLRAVFEDGRSANFSLRGSARTIDPQPCETWQDTLAPLFVEEPPAATFLWFMNDLEAGDVAALNSYFLPGEADGPVFGGRSVVDYVRGIKSNFEYESVGSIYGIETFEANYSYIQLDGTLCDARALINVELVGDRLVIRSIDVNC
ncbi:hypothetical protein [Salinarimonas sp.]|uniref:hypothetical protein n=1 Tax=Salinarimonas sp. TaxID=2766526 RepID=UPI0032D8F56D